MKSRFLVGVAVAIACSLQASTISVGEFRINTPAGWSAARVSNGYDATGPDRAVMRIRVYSIAGGIVDDAGKRAAKNVRNAAVEAVAQTVRENGLAEQLPLRTRKFRDGTLEESLHTTADALGYLAFYVLTGRRSVVVATVEGSATQIKQIVPIRQSFVAALGGDAASK